jgi:DNA-binding PadR family transcriptional regulator
VQSKRVSPGYVLLGFLYGQSGYGYELHKRLRDEFGLIWHISQSQTYSIINRLITSGYISINTIVQEKLPSRQQLMLTEEGKKHFESWLETPTRCSVHAIRVEFVTRLYFAQLYDPESCQGMITDQLVEVDRGLKQLKTIKGNLPEDQAFNRLALDLRINLLTSIGSWLEDCKQEFNTSKQVRKIK